MLQGKRELVRDYVASIPFDQRLYHHDIQGSIAHARMLARQHIIAETEAQALVEALTSIRREIEENSFPFKAELEDIHMNVEARLFQKVGDLAGKLHTARSRNDQVVLDLRLYVREETLRTVNEIRALQASLVGLAEDNRDTIIPGYTHLQQAQPILVAHHLLAYFDMLQRDRERFLNCIERTSVLPLGSGALAGVPYPLDRDYVAEQLGFGKVSTNSLDAVSDRDFVIEYEASAAITMMHTSRLAEEMILWSSSEFGFIEIDQAHTTGSSIMPQKRNPDVAELARGKTGRVYGHLMGTLTMMKGLPLAYNRDLQEDKEGLFDTVDTLVSSLRVLADMVRSTRFLPDRILAAVKGDYILATDLADYLVKKGMPFREAHRIMGTLSEYALSSGKNFAELSMAEYKGFSELFENDVYGITLESSIAARDLPGGTSPQQVAAALEAAKRLMRE